MRTKTIRALSLTALTAALLTGCAPEPGEQSGQTAEETTIPSATGTEADAASDGGSSETGSSESSEAAAPQPGAGPDCPTDHCVSVAVAGDLLFHEGLWTPFALNADTSSTTGPNFDFMPLFESAKPYLDQADLAICQMETPLAPVGGPYLGYPNFSTPPEVADAAKSIGFDACTTASNHSVDQGHEGLARTLDKLDEVSLAHTGTYREEGERDVPLIVEANGAKVGIINATFSVNGNFNEFDWQVDYRETEPRTDPERMIEKARAAREAGADLVIGVQHIGEEYWTEPTAGVVELFHQLADSGEFDFLYGHHPHAIQPLEKYGDTWILYSTGNFISESAPPANRVNNEFLLTRVQFAEQADGSWSTNDVAWAAATNMQNGGYKWCPVTSEQPEGVCQSPEFDADVLERTRATVNAMGAADAGAHEWVLGE